MYHRKIILNKNRKETSAYCWSLMKWADSQFPLVSVLNSNAFLPAILKRKKGTKGFDFILAAGKKRELLPAPRANFDKLKDFYEQNCRNFGGIKKNKKVSEQNPVPEKNPFLFGFLNYDLKNEIENLTSSHPDFLGLPIMHFFLPEYIFILKKKRTAGFFFRK